MAKLPLRAIAASVVFLLCVVGCPSLRRQQTATHEAAQGDDLLLETVDIASLLRIDGAASPGPQPLALATGSPAYEYRRYVRPAITGRLGVPLGRRWDSMVIHHSSTPSGSAAIFDRYHREKLGWQGVGYDFVIGNGRGSADGTIEVTFRWERQIHGAHAGVQQYNEHGIGICLVGDFERSYPTQAQVESLVWLVTYLQERCGIPTSHVLLHRHVKNTRCPGENFPFYKLLSLLPH